MDKEDVRVQRARYMAQEITHEEYYLWLSDSLGLPNSLIPVSLDRIRQSTDPHLNDIPLVLWDRQDYAVRRYASRKGIAWSLSDTVCCLKAMAHRAASRSQP